MLGLLIGSLGTAAITEWATPTVDVIPGLWRDFAGALGRFLRAFLLSPGFGALAALVAAAVAFESSRRVIAEQRRQAGLERLNALDDREEDRWYRMYELVYEHATTTSPTAATLTLEALDELADTEEQETYVIALAEHLKGRQTP